MHITYSFLADVPQRKQEPASWLAQICLPCLPDFCLAGRLPKCVAADVRRRKSSAKLITTVRLLASAATLSLALICLDLLHVLQQLRDDLVGRLSLRVSLE